ncbi:hypothetical protein DIPPA_15084 [Diplonema papillatum]|nr:hypothetical protein DIPPA_15084 [Diplonema papillatum]
MAMFYELSNQAAEVESLLLECGRAAHMLRNYVQGYNSLCHPELKTCDNLAGQLEGVLRTASAHLKEGKEVKQFLPPLAKSATFLSRIFDEGFFADAGVDEETVTNIRHLVASVRDSAHRIDAVLNLAILRQSASLFGGGAEMNFSPPVYTASAVVSELFDPPMKSHERCADTADVSTADLRGWMAALGCHLSNKAHAMQEVMSVHIIDAATKDVANQVINIAGQAENDGRALVARYREESLAGDKTAKLLGQLDDKFISLGSLSKDPRCPQSEGDALTKMIADGQELVSRARLLSKTK